MNTPLTFPADYATAPTYYIPINASLIPFLAGALAMYENESIWFSEIDYEQAYSAFVALKARLMALNTAQANYVLSGPSTGDPSPAAFRRLVVADLPALAYSALTGIPATFAPISHATSHSAAGADPVTPASIGAASSSHTHALAYSSLSGIPSTFAPTNHASQHAAAGADPLAYWQIGAAAAVHNHTINQLTDLPAIAQSTTPGALVQAGGGGTINDNWLSSNMARLNTVQSWSAGQTMPSINVTGSGLVGSAGGSFSVNTNDQGIGGIWVNGNSTTAGRFALVARDSNASNLMYTRNDHLQNWSVIAWTIGSDRAQKTNIRDLDRSIEDLKKIKPRTYDRPLPETNKEREHGFIAQELREVLPELVDIDMKGELCIRYTELIPLLVAAVQQQAIEIADLQSKLPRTK